MNPPPVSPSYNPCPNCSCPGFYHYAPVTLHAIGTDPQPCDRLLMPGRICGCRAAFSAEAQAGTVTVAEKMKPSPLPHVIPPALPNPAAVNWEPGSRGFVAGRFADRTPSQKAFDVVAAALFAALFASFAAGAGYGAWALWQAVKVAGF